MKVVTDRLPRATASAVGRRGPRSFAAALLCLALCACGAAANPSSTRTSDPEPAPGAAGAAPTPAAVESPCGTATPTVVSDTAGAVAQTIYRGEISGREVGLDRSQVERDGSLLSALAEGNRAAVTEAVTSLVYSGTHIVRLRVSAAGNVLADVGGPYILAPVSGSLHFKGRTVGHYVLSVQDDLGYVKLFSRFVGYPLILRLGSHRVPLEGTISGSSLPTRGAVSYHGGAYQVFSFKAKAFPSGRLTISLLVPVSGSSRLSCAVLRANELRRIAMTTWQRFAAIGGAPSAYVTVVGGFIGGLSYVRAGSHQLAGTTQPGPPHLPDTGEVSYRGVTYRVTSFPASVAGEPVRIFELTR